MSGVSIYFVLEIVRFRDYEGKIYFRYRPWVRTDKEAAFPDGCSPLSSARGTSFFVSKSGALSLIGSYADVYRRAGYVVHPVPVRVYSDCAETGLLH